MHNACGRKAALSALTERDALDASLDDRAGQTSEELLLIEEETDAPSVRMSVLEKEHTALFADGEFLLAALRERLPDGPEGEVAYVRSSCLMANAMALGRREPDTPLIEAVRPEEQARFDGLHALHRRGINPSHLTLIPLHRRQYEGFRSMLRSLNERGYLGFLFDPQAGGWSLDTRDRA